MLTRVVRTAKMRIPAQLGTAPPLNAATNWPPIMTLTTDQPIQAATLNSAMMMPPTHPNEKRDIVIWRSPNLGPRVEKNATGRTPSALKMRIIAKLSQNPRPKMGIANAPRPTVEITRLAESHMVKLSMIRTWARVRSEEHTSELQ